MFVWIWRQGEDMDEGLTLGVDPVLVNKRGWVGLVKHGPGKGNGLEGCWMGGLDL